MNRFNIVVAALLLAAATGCSKKAPDSGAAGTDSAAATAQTPPPATAEASSKAKMLTDKAWKATEVTADPAIDFNGDGKANTELLTSGEFLPCQLDDTETYGSDGSYTTDHGATKCDSTEKEKEVGTWKFNADSTMIITSTGGSEIKVNLLELSDGKMKASMPVDKDGKTYTIVATFAH